MRRVPNFTYAVADVRDIAACHIVCLEKKEANGKLHRCTWCDVIGLKGQQSSIGLQLFVVFLAIPFNLFCIAVCRSLLLRHTACTFGEDPPNHPRELLRFVRKNTQWTHLMCMFMIVDLHVTSRPAPDTLINLASGRIVKPLRDVILLSLSKPPHIATRRFLSYSVCFVVINFNFLV